MRYLLDTNVVSELRKGDRTDPGLQEWFAGVDRDDLALSVLVLAEASSASSASAAEIPSRPGTSRRG